MSTFSFQLLSEFEIEAKMNIRFWNMDATTMCKWSSSPARWPVDPLRDGQSLRLLLRPESGVTPAADVLYALT